MNENATSTMDDLCKPAWTPPEKPPILETSDKLDKILPALLKAQSEMESAKKTAENPHFRSSYADIADVIEAAKVPLGKNGLVIVQGASPVRRETEMGYVVEVHTRIYHAASAQFIGNTISASTQEPGPQKVGGLHTYLRRYGLQVLCVLPAEDDDGNTAQGNPPRGGGDPRKDPHKAATPRKAPKGAPAPPKPVPVPQVQKLIDQLCERIGLNDTPGDPELQATAKQVLLEITEGIDGDGEHIEGFSDVNEFRTKCSAPRAVLAMTRLKAHPQFGDTEAR